MDEGVQTAPFLSDTFEYGLQLPGRIDVSGMKIGRFELLGERFDEFPGLVVDVGDRHIGAERTECFGASPGDGVLVRYTDDQALLPSNSFAFAVGIMAPVVLFFTFTSIAAPSDTNGTLRDFFRSRPA